MSGPLITSKETMVVLLFRVVPAFALALFMLPPLGDYDTWFYLDMGRWMLDHGAYLDEEIRTFTSPGAHVYNVSWLFQILLAGVYRLGGLYGLLALQMALLFGELLILATAAVRKPKDGMPFVFALAILAPEFAGHYTLRPHLVAHLCLAGLVLLFRQPTRSPKLLGFALLLLIWANCHGSAMVGAGVVALHLMVDQEPRQAIPRHGRRLVLAAGFLLLPFATPMGTDIFELMKATQADVASLPISEWSSPEVYPPFLFLAVAGYLITLLTRNQRFLAAELVLVLFYFLQTTQHIRFMHELAILVTLPVTFFITLLVQRMEPIWRGLTPVLLCAIFIILSGFYHPRFPHWRSFPQGYPLDIEALPQGSTALINGLAQETGRPLRVLNPYEWGGYLAFVLEDRASLFVDGRASMVFDRNLVRDSFHAYRTNSALLKHLANQWRVDLILAHQRGKKEDMEIPWDDPEWRLIGFDKVSLLYVRRESQADLAAGKTWPEIPYLPGMLATSLPVGQLRGAIQATRALAQRFSDNPWVWAQLGVLENRLLLEGGAGDPELALTAWRQAWRSMRSAEMRLHFARSLQLAKRPEEEIKALLKDLPVPLPGSAPPYLENLAADVYLKLGLPRESLRMLSPEDKYRLDQLDNQPLTWFLRGQAWNALGEKATADAHLEKGRTISPVGKWPPSLEDFPQKLE